MAILETILLGAAGSALYGLTRESALAAIDYLNNNRPDLVARVEAAQTSVNLGAVIAGALEVAAAEGSVEIDGALIMAMTSATFDHQQGDVLIEGASISAPTLVTGGGHDATGETRISGSILDTGGTQVRLGPNASIVIRGNASMRQGKSNKP